MTHHTQTNVPLIDELKQQQLRDRDEKVEPWCKIHNVI